MSRCIRERIECQIQYYVQVVQWFREDSDKIGELFFDGEGNPCGSEAGEYGITLTRTQEEGLVYVLLESRDMQGEELYTLRAPICVREEGQDG